MRNISERLRDIQDAIARIMKYTQDGRYRYDHDELVQTWVTHNLYVIGEATRAIANDSPDFKDQHPEIKWTEIIGMRTILAHRYFEIDPNALWAAVTQDLQDLKRSIDAILKDVTLLNDCPWLVAKFVRKTLISRLTLWRQKYETRYHLRHNLSESSNWTLMMSKSVNHHDSWPLFHHNPCHSQGSENRVVFLHVAPV